MERIRVEVRVEDYESLSFRKTGNPNFRRVGIYDDQGCQAMLLKLFPLFNYGTESGIFS